MMQLHFHGNSIVLLVGILNIYSMKILKKVQQLKEYSKTLFSKSNKISDTPKGMIDYIISHSDHISNEHLLVELAQTTHNSSHTTEIANILTSKLEKFQYSEACIRNSFALLECIIYILKNGNSKFSLDISGNKGIFEELQAVNSRYFENKFIKKSKELNYTLEMIKQKATHIKQLIQQPLMLSQERQKVQRNKDIRLSRLQNMELSVQCETNVNLKKEISEPVYISCSNRHKKQGSTKIVQIEEQVAYEIQEINGKNQNPILGPN